MRGSLLGKLCHMVMEPVKSLLFNSLPLSWKPGDAGKKFKTESPQNQKNWGYNNAQPKAKDPRTLRLLLWVWKAELRFIKAVEHEALISKSKRKKYIPVIGREKKSPFSCNKFRTTDWIVFTYMENRSSPFTPQ